MTRDEFLKSLTDDEFDTLEFFVGSGVELTVLGDAELNMLPWFLHFGLVKTEVEDETMFVTLTEDGARVWAPAEEEKGR